MTTPAVGNQCARCKNWLQSPMLKNKRPVCLAFPDGIPEEILEDEYDHRGQYPGDHGIRYEEYKRDSGINATPPPPFPK